MSDAIDREALIADLRERLSDAMSQMWDHMPHGCELAIAMQGTAYAYAALLYAYAEGPDPQFATTGDIAEAHGISMPWDETGVREVTITADMAEQMMEAFAVDLAALDGLDADGKEVLRPF